MMLWHICLEEAMNSLCVMVCHNPAGTLSMDARGVVSFRYFKGYDGTPLSMSMPVTGIEYAQKVVRPYLFGLLPDSEDQRAAIAKEYGISPNNPVALLSHIGLDCPGAVQFCTQHDLAIASVIARKGEYRPLTDHEIADRLKIIRNDRDSTWVGIDERWSLGGNQGKFALAYVDDRWCSCVGAAPTTHIIKNGVIGFKYQALNEYVCMRVAKLCGINAADVSYRFFEDEPALIIKRYDRIKRKDGHVTRCHQEDMCQALAVMPDKKYTSDGGPKTQDIIGVISKLSFSKGSLESFVKMLFYNCLIGAPDAHAKNYAILYANELDTILAPMYDVASGLAYDLMRNNGRLAMAIGGENRFGRISGNKIRKFAGKNETKIAAIFDRNEVTADWCIDTMASLAQSVPSAMEHVFAETDVDGIDELCDHMMHHVAGNCNRILSLL